MNFLIKSFFYLSISIVLITFPVFPLSANAQNETPSTAVLHGDGISDLVWCKTSTGETAIWMLNGTSVSSNVSLNIDLNTTITACEDLNGDGKADLLWYNTPTGQTLVWLVNGTRAASPTNLAMESSSNLKFIEAASVTSTASYQSTVVSRASASKRRKQAPVVYAGADQSIAFPAVAYLSGSASEDGSPSTLLTATWTQVTGPGTVKFAGAADLSTTAEFSAAGTYTLRLTASDGSRTAADDIVVVVSGCGPIVSGVVRIQADAIDNVGVVGVQAKLDGTNFGPYLTMAPYSVVWDTKTISNGCHQFSVTATDKAGNLRSASLFRDVSNPK